MMARVVLISLVVTVGCAKTGEAPAPPTPIQAGPRAILEEPGAESAPADGLSIGRNEAVAYAQEVRVAVMPAFRACSADLPATDDVTLVVARVTPAGRAANVVVSRTSGNAEVDDCARRAFEEAELPPPPPRLVDETGAFEPPPFAFARP